MGAPERGWRPQILPAEQHAFADGSYFDHPRWGQIEVIDRLAAQRAELAQLRGPIEPELRREPPQWVLYPWRRQLIKLLGPRAFARLRCDRNRNKITLDEQARLRRHRVLVVGLSVGHAIASVLAQEGLCGQLLLADYDTLSLSNLNRIPASVDALGDNKAIALARRIAEIDPYLPIEIEPAGATVDNLDRLLKGCDLVIDECDGIDLKFALRFAARAAGLPVIMQTSDGAILDVERFDLEPERPLFHGLVEVDDAAALAGLSTADKVPLVLDILEAEAMAARQAASLVEIDAQLETWPQLASDVQMGAAMVGAAVRSWGLAQPLPSGRTRLDLAAQLADPVQPRRPANAPWMAPSEPPAADFGERLIDAAVRAPSGGNGQPWRFAVVEGGLDIFLDPARSSLMDIEGRGSLLALGAAGFNAEVAAAAAGRALVADLPAAALTAAQRRGEQAVIALRPAPGVSPVELAALAPWIERRACARACAASGPLDQGWCERADATAALLGAPSVRVAGEGLRALREIWAEADRLRFLSPALHREMMSELRWPGEDPRRGIDVQSLALRERDMAALKLARRADVMAELAAWDGGDKLGDGARQLLDASAALWVLGCPGTGSAGDYLRAGRLLQRLWLDAARSGVGLQPMSPLFLYAHSPGELAGRCEPAQQRPMWALRERAMRTCGLAADQPLALTCRVTSLTEVRQYTQREPRSARRVAASRDALPS